MAEEPGTRRSVKRDFESWARLSARLRRVDHSHRLRLLRRIGVEAWRELDSYWFVVLQRDIEAGYLERWERYVAFCEEERQIHEKTYGPLPSPLDPLRG